MIVVKVIMKASSAFGFWVDFVLWCCPLAVPWLVSFSFLVGFPLSFWVV